MDGAHAHADAHGAVPGGEAVTRFLCGLAAGAGAGGLFYAVEPVRPWWWVAAFVMAYLVWFTDLPDVF